MMFGSVSIDDALGGVAVHSIRQGSLVLRKGTRIGAAEIAALRQEGIATIVIARASQGDVTEDMAAAMLAARLAGPGIRVADAFTGRANLHATQAGVLRVERAGIDRLNAIDESITFATLADFAAVEPGEMVATVKIIPFAVEAAVLDRALATIERPFASWHRSSR